MVSSDTVIKFMSQRFRDRVSLASSMASQDLIGVVLDTGSQCTKAGFAGEVFPRAVLPTTVARFRRPGLIDGLPLIYCGKEAIKKRGISHLTWPVVEGLIQNWDEMEKLWYHVLYQELHVPPEDSRIMHAVHPLAPIKDKERMSEILFECFAIHGLYLGVSPALVLHASGRTSGLVWEDGYSSSYAAPVFEGFPLKHAIVCSPLTGAALSNYLQKLMAETGYSLTTPFERDLLDTIKAEKCYVARDYETERNTACSGNKIRYQLPDGQHLMLGDERYRCPELLFQPSIGQRSCPNIVDLIWTSVMKCDMDYRALFFRNVVISGGTSMFSGLVDRLSAELSLRLIKKLPDFKAEVDAMSSRQYAVWTGGSILASLSSMNGFWMTKEEYDDAGTDRVRYKFF